MIQNKSDLVLFLESDKIALDRKRMRPSINDEIWRYQIALRKCEYFQNCSNNMFMKIQGCVWRIIKHHLGVKCGFSIPNNVIGPGLCLAHIGPIMRIDILVLFGCSRKNRNTIEEYIQN